MPTRRARCILLLSSCLLLLAVSYAQEKPTPTIPGPNSQLNSALRTQYPARESLIGNAGGSALSSGAPQYDRIFSRPVLPVRKKSRATLSDTLTPAWVTEIVSERAPAEASGWDIAFDTTGNVYALGIRGLLPFGSVMTVVKYDGSGTELWRKDISKPATVPSAAPMGLVVGRSGAVYVAGNTVGDDHIGETVVVALDPDGTERWRRYDDPDVLPSYGAEHIGIDAAENIYLLGNVGGDVVLLMISRDGDLVWSDSYDGPSGLVDRGDDLVVSENGRATIVLTSDEIQYQNDIVMIQYDAAGNRVFERVYNGGEGYTDDAGAVAVGPDGSVFVAGSSRPNGHSGGYFLIKYDSAGTLLWTMEYPSTNGDFVHDVVVDDSGYAYLTGQGGGSGFPDMFTVKVGPDGSVHWADGYNGPGGDFDAGVELGFDDNGDLYVAGWSRSNGAVYTSDDYAVVKYSPDGTRIWVQRYDGAYRGYDDIRALAVGPRGRLAVTGVSEAAMWDDDMVTILYDTAGAQVWLTRVDGEGGTQDYFRHVTVGPNGSYYATGGSRTGTTWSDIYTAGFHRTGGVRWSSWYDGIVSGYEYPVAIRTDAHGNVYVLGESDGENTYRDIVTLRYDQSGVLEWVARYDNDQQGWDSPVSMRITNEGDILILGSSTDAAQLLLRYAPSGVLLWKHVGGLDGAPISLLNDGQENAYILTQSWGRQSGYILQKFDRYGSLVWETRNDSDVTRVLGAMNQEEDMIIVTGIMNLYDPDQHLVTTAYSLSGDLLWQRHEQPAEWPMFNVGIRFTPSGECIAVTHSFGSQPTTFLHWYGKYGSHIWSTAIASSDLRDIHDLTVDKALRVHLIMGDYSSLDLTFVTRQPGAHSGASRSFTVPPPFTGLSIARMLDQGDLLLVGSRGGWGWSFPIIATVSASQMALAGWGIPRVPGVRMYPPYPNPFNGFTTIRLNITSPEYIRVTVCDLLGRTVAQLAEGVMGVGEYDLPLNAGPLASGVYLLRMISQTSRDTKKMVLVR